MCCLVCIIILPVLVTCILYDLLWWLWSPLPITVPWIHRPLSFCWTATVDPTGIDIKIFEVSLFQLFLPCLCIKFLWCSSSLSMMIGFLSIRGIMPHTERLNKNVAGLGSHWLSGMILICSNAMCISQPESSILFITGNLLWKSTMHKYFLLLNWNKSAPFMFHGLTGIS